MRRLNGPSAGRIFFVPYSHIDYFGFQQPLKDSEFHEMFGGLTVPEAGTAPTPTQAPSAPAAPQAPTPASVERTEELPAPPGLSPPSRPEIKSAVLERFRARTASVYQPPGK